MDNLNSLSDHSALNSTETPPQRMRSVLWIPCCFHRCIEPLYIGEDEDSERSCNEERRIYLYDEEGYLDIDLDIQLTNVLISDYIEPDTYINLTLKAETPEGIQTRESSDDPKSTPKRDIDVVAVTAEGYTEHLYLKCIEACKSGLFMYEYEFTPGKPRVLLNSKGNVTHAVYHAIKRFYHQHEFHRTSADSITDPYSSKDKFSIRSINNAALLHYLMQFEYVFLKHVKELGENKQDLMTTLVSLKETKEVLDKQADALNKRFKRSCKKERLKKLEARLVKNADKTETNNTKLIKWANECHQEVDKCATIIGKHIYYQSLAYSKYNNLFNIASGKETQYVLTDMWKSGRVKQESLIKLKVDHGLSDKKAYQSAINIQNSITWIERLKTELKTAMIAEYHKIAIDGSIVLKKQSEDLYKLNKKAEAQSKFSTRLAIWGTVFAIVSIFLAVGFARFDYLYYKDSASKKHALKLLENDSIHTVLVTSSGDSLKALKLDVKRIQDSMNKPTIKPSPTKKVLPN